MSSQQFRVLKESVRHDTSTAIMSFKSAMKQNAYLIVPNGQQTKARMPATEVMHTLGEGKDILVVSGTFKLLHPIAGTFADEEVVNQRIPVETRWGGNSTLRHLHALIPPVGQDKARPFIVVRPSDKVQIEDSLFIGPIADDQVEATRAFLQFLVTSPRETLSQTELLDMLQCGRLLDARFALEELRTRSAGLSAKHFLLAIRALPEEYSAELAHDLFMESRRSRTVRNTMHDALRFFLDGSSQAKEAKVLDALRVAIERMSWKKDNAQLVPEVLLLLKDYCAQNIDRAGDELSRAEAERIMKLLSSEERSKHE